MADVVEARAVVLARDKRVSDGEDAGLIHRFCAAPAGLPRGRSLKDVAREGTHRCRARPPIAAVCLRGDSPQLPLAQGPWKMWSQSPRVLL